MAKVSFETLRRNYPYPETLSATELFDELGWSKEEFIKKPEFKNTCAVRMSYCLVRSGINIQGGFNILKGKHKGKRIETSQKKLTEYMRRSLQAHIGTPSKFNKSDKNNFLTKGKKGIMSFMEISGYSDASGNASGHIDLIWTEKNSLSVLGWTLWSALEEQCGSSCYWDDAKELLFWELQ